MGIEEPVAAGAFVTHVPSARDRIRIRAVLEIEVGALSYFISLSVSTSEQLQSGNA